MKGNQKRLEEAKRFCRNKHLAWFYFTKNQKNRKAFIYFMPNLALYLSRGICDFEKRRGR